MRHQTEVADIVAKDPDIIALQRATSAARWRRRRRRLNQGRMSVDLKPRAERTRSVDQIIADLRPKVAQVPGVRVFMVNQPPINLGGQQGPRSTYQFTLQDTDTAELYRAAPLLEEKMRAMPGIEDVNSDLRLNNPQIQHRHGSRPDLVARPDREPGGDGALQRLRHAAGVADLRAEQSVPGDPAAWRRSSSRIPRRCRMLYVRSSSGKLDAAEHGGDGDDQGRGR